MHAFQLLLLPSLIVALASFPAPPPLHQLFVAYGKLYFGAAVSTQNITPKSQAAGLIPYVFGQVTPENSMKWEPTERTRGKYTWDPADKLVDFAANHSLLVRGHTAIFASQLPTWLTNIKDKREMEKAVRERTRKLVGRYSGKIYAWDVLNDALNDDGNLKDTIFSRLLGEDFVRIAFEEARRADPQAKLYINDNNLDSPKKTQGMVRLLQKWRSQGIPIDGIGFQARLKPGQGGGVKAALESVCSAIPDRFECAITELEVEQASGDDYAHAVRACLQVRNCVGVTVWGIRDTDSWHKQTSPLLFDANWNPKPAYDAIVKVLVMRETQTEW